MKQGSDIGISKRTLALVHVIFWVVFFGIILAIFFGFLPIEAALIRSSFLTIYLALIFYINTQLLVNYFFERKKHIAYTTSLLLFSFAVIRFKIFADFEWLNKETAFLQVAGTKSGKIVSSFPVIFDLIFSTLLQMLLNHYKRIRSYKQRLTELSNAQLQLLKGQINPHFLFNNLNNIYSLVVTKSENAPEMILKLSDLLRYVIYKSNNQKVSITEEVEQLKNMIALNELKGNENKNIDLNTQNITTNGFIEPMILIPLLENCFKHWDGGFNPNAYIKINITSNNSCFTFETINTVPITPLAKIKGEGGLGLENLKNRLVLTYSEKVNFEIHRTDNLFKVKLTIQW